MIDIKLVQSEILALLSSHLSGKHTYHSKGHTKDVVKQALHIADCEGVTDPHELQLLETAAWFHDTGFINVPHEHERESCRIAREKLPLLGASAADIERISELIMATKIPQSPSCYLAKILCDADLDYLGRSDFQSIASLLEKEWIEFDMLKERSQFNEIQIRFLDNHKYFTQYSRQNREPIKRKHLKNLRKEEA